MTKIGLEIHCQLTNLESKLFCPCKANYRGFEPNSNICPICVGLPGTLPRLNKEAIKKALIIAMALNCQIPNKIAFFRKNYFYPDLPKNYQITQLNLFGETSIGNTGKVTVGENEIRIRRIQLEEDPGRLIYEGISERTQVTLVDYNRSGTPLVEIVTEPDFNSPKQVRQFLNMLSDLLENLDVSDPSLEGAMRADANVSVEEAEKVEIKNIGSFYDLEKAVNFEITRQESLVSRNIAVLQETRHWDDRRKITVASRSKEEEMDYRYFLESDIPWIKLDTETIEFLKKEMPESIISKTERYKKVYNVPSQVAEILAGDKYYSDLFEKAHDSSNAKDIANFITTDLMGLVDTREKRGKSKLEPTHLKELVDLIKKNELSRNSAKLAIQEIINSGKSVREVVAELNLGSVSNEEELTKIIDDIINKEVKAVEEAKTHPQTINYLVGKVMKKTRGKADPKKTLELLKQKVNQ